MMRPRSTYICHDFMVGDDGGGDRVTLAYVDDRGHVHRIALVRDAEEPLVEFVGCDAVPDGFEVVDSLTGEPIELPPDGGGNRVPLPRHNTGATLRHNGRLVVSTNSPCLAPRPRPEKFTTTNKTLKQ